MTTRREVSTLPHTEDKYNGVTVDLRDLYDIVDFQQFETILKGKFIPSYVFVLKKATDSQLTDRQIYSGTSLIRTPLFPD